MKKLLPALAGFLFSVAASAQSVPNGGFENWNSSSFEDPFYYQTSNVNNLLRGLPTNVEKVTDPQQGTYAVKLTTVSNGTDTSFGYLINGDPSTMAGGIPYNQHPVTLSGYYKSDIAAGDTGIILVVFKQNGIPLSTDVGIFTGQHTSYTPFTITLNIPALSTPDSVLLGIVSSNAFVSNGIPGSMLQVDNLVFNGVSSQPVNLNGSFENWVGHTQYTPQDWVVGGDTLFRDNNAHGGSYCLRMQTVSYGGSNVGPGIATTGQLPPNYGPTGGRPYAQTSDSLTGWYRYIPVGTDSATVWIQTSLNHVPIGGAFVGLPAAAGWTRFSIPFSSAGTPDTLMVTFASVFNNFDSTNIGSVLFVDDVYLKSSLVSTGNNWNQFGLVTLFPNPATDYTWLNFTCTNEASVTISIVDESGRKISEKTISGMGAQHYQLETANLAAGMYSVVIEQEGAKTIRRFVKQ